MSPSRSASASRFTSSTTPLLNYIRPYVGYGPVNVVENWFDSNYHSLQALFEKRFSHGLQFQASYTFSKSLDNASSGAIASAARPDSSSAWPLSSWK